MSVIDVLVIFTILLLAFILIFTSHKVAMMEDKARRNYYKGVLELRKTPPEVLKLAELQREYERLTTENLIKKFENKIEELKYNQ